MELTSSFIFAYLLGGITFIPLLVIVIFLHAFLFLPRPSDSPPPPSTDPRNIRRTDDDRNNIRSGADILADKFTRKHESDVAAGYFAVCREYVPGGVNGKPPERTTPSGEIMAVESPSVYQTMYRSIFDRQQKPTIQPSKSDGKTVKRARNVFFVVLRHGHLMLYDDSEQLDVRHVISLEHHDVSIYGGPEEIPEGELWIKRNAICLTRNRKTVTANQAVSLPFFLFSENCSEKEDFYFALLKNQEKISTSTGAPIPQEYDVKDIITLVKKLHSSEEYLQTRWLNAVIGRLFLAMYKTPELEEIIRLKMTKKISRVKKPNFITKLSLRKIETGEGAPFITNPKLKDLTVDGDCVAEADVKYSGKFRIEIAATATLDLGTRFKAREVDLVLAVVVNKIEGHALIHFKPPPSNRIWVSFETMPTLDLKIEPIVSSRQITYNIVLRAIESRVREVFAETLVLPFWDDVPFMDTRGQEHRGGIWKRAVQPQEPIDIQEEVPEDELETDDNHDLEVLKTRDEKSLSDPNLSPPPSSDLKVRDGKVKTWVEESGPASPSGMDKSHRAEPPRAIRSTSFASMADPLISPSHADSRRDFDNAVQTDNARNMLRELSNKNSISASPTDSPAGSLPDEVAITAALSAAGKRRTSSKESDETPLTARPQQQSENDSSHTGSQASSIAEAPTTASNESKPPSLEGEPSRASTIASSIKSLASSSPSTSEKRGPINIGTATAAAKNWGWGVLARNQQRREQEAAKSQSKAGESSPSTTAAPMGRGRPFPPPGQPLPHPERSLLSSIPLPQRRTAQTKSNVPQAKPGRSTNGADSSSDTGNSNGKSSKQQRPTPKNLPTPLDRRHRQQSSRNSARLDGHGDDEGLDEEEVVVVEAPVDSNPSSPGGAEEGEDSEREAKIEAEVNKSVNDASSQGGKTPLGNVQAGDDEGPKLPPRRQPAG